MPEMKEEKPAVIPASESEHSKSKSENLDDEAFPKGDSAPVKPAPGRLPARASRPWPFVSLCRAETHFRILRTSR
jgi:hypothetical protein